MTDDFYTHAKQHDVARVERLMPFSLPEPLLELSEEVPSNANNVTFLPYLVVQDLLRKKMDHVKVELRWVPQCDVREQRT